MKKSRVIMNVPAKTTGSGPNLSTIVLSFPAANHRVVFGVGAHTPASARLSRTPRKGKGFVSQRIQIWDVRTTREPRCEIQYANGRAFGHDQRVCTVVGASLRHLAVGRGFHDVNVGASRPAELGRPHGGRDRSGRRVAG